MKKVLHDHFVPHVGNNYAPHILQKAAMIAMLGLVLVSFTMANLQALLWTNIDWLVASVLPAVVVAETNEERADGALAGLTRNTTLDRAAQLKAEHMAELGYFAHYAPDGTSPWYWFQITDYSFVHAGENLAVHFNDSRQVVQAWMDSPTHRANIMNGDYTEIGIGVAEGEYEGFETLFVVQLFGTPTAAPTVAQAPADTDTITVVTEQVSTPSLVAQETTADTDTPQVAAAEETIVEAPLATPSAVEPEQTPELESVPDTVLPDTTTLPETPLASQPTPTTTDITETVLVAAPTDSFISTSTAGVPATVRSAEAPRNLSAQFGFATSPQQVLQFIYVALGLFVVAALSLALLLEFRRHQPVQIAYSIGLLAIMGGLYYVQTIVTSGAVIV